MPSSAAIFPTDMRTISRARISIGLLATAITIAGILVVKPTSLAHFVWFFCLWNGIVLLLHREQSSNFAFAFLLNSAYVVVFVLVQSWVYPDTYGTTSPLSPSWTDDSYFFSMAADTVPSDLLTRPFYWEYQASFSMMVRAVTPLPISHPLDVLFFQSGTAALLSMATSKLMFQLSRDRRLADYVFVFTIVCPFLMMNGGVIFLRDSLTAALFVYSLTFINERKYVSALVVFALQVAMRPGTGAILAFAYPVIYFVEVRAFVGKHPIACATLVSITVVLAVVFGPLAFELLASNYGKINSVNLLGREVLAELSADSNVNTLFLAIQDLPFVVRLLMNAAYTFMYPFLTLRPLTDSMYFDLRSVMLGVVAPIYSLWLNAWFFAGALRGKPVIERQRAITVAIVVILMLVGTYSLQTRHKTIIYPLYYILIAVGFAKATPNSRRVGYAISTAFFLVQMASALR